MLTKPKLFAIRYPKKTKRELKHDLLLNFLFNCQQAIKHKNNSNGKQN